mgnify:CR=1 FL=1
MGKMKRLFIEMQEEAAQEARDQFGLHIPEEPIMTSNKIPAIPVSYTHLTLPTILLV